MLFLTIDTTAEYHKPLSLPLDVLKTQNSYNNGDDAPYAADDRKITLIIMKSSD